jgi:hypothetical protein
VNVHGFYYFVVPKTGPRRYLLSPKWDVGLMAGDLIETCEAGTFRSLGRTQIVQLTKRKAPELKAQIAQIWKNKSPTTRPDTVYDIELQEDLPLKIADAGHLTQPDRLWHGDPAMQLSRLRACRGQVAEFDCREQPVFLFLDDPAAGRE